MEDKFVRGMFLVNIENISNKFVMNIESPQVRLRKYLWENITIPPSVHSIEKIMNIITSQLKQNDFAASILNGNRPVLTLYLQGIGSKFAPEIKKQKFRNELLQQIPVADIRVNLKNSRVIYSTHTSVPLNLERFICLAIMKDEKNVNIRG